MLSKNIFFIYWSIFFLLWVFIHNLTEAIFISLIVLLFLVVLFFFYFFLTKKFIKLILLVLLSFCLWVLTSENNFNNIDNKSITLNNYYDNKNYNIVLEVQNIHKIKEFQIEYIVRIKEIEWYIFNKNIKAVIKVSKSYKLEKWYIIKTKTKLYEFEDFNDFSYKNFMLSKNIYFNSIIYDFEIVEKKEINFIESKIIKLRIVLLDAIYKIYPKEEAIFLWGILIWARESLPKDLKEDFNNSWLTHFIAVSWFNITILIIFLTYSLKYFPIFIRVIVITIFIALFTILVWDTAPVIRASIMGLIWYYALMSWRKWNVLSIILVTSVVMILYSPLSLNYDVSLHLSFLAVLWIVYTQKFFEKVFDFIPNFLEIRTAFTLTLSALVFTLPIMIFNFGQVSILAPFANIAVTWTIPIAMLLGFISILVYLVFPVVWIFIWYITWIFLKWDMLVVRFFWNIEWALLKIDFWIYKYHIEIVYFMVLIFLIIWFRKKNKLD